MKKEIICKRINIKGKLPRNEIVKKVVNTIIKEEYSKKGKGIIFRYPVESLPSKKLLYIVRPGHKKNFDFKVEVTKEMIMEEGKHDQIAMDLRVKKENNEEEFINFFKAVNDIYQCNENNVDHLLRRYPSLETAFKTGAKNEILLKVLKWMFIMEDIVYWDVEGRAFLYNYLLYVVNETDDNRLGEAMDKIKDPSRLKSFMKKANVEWVPYKD